MPSQNTTLESLLIDNKYKNSRIWTNRQSDNLSVKCTVKFCRNKCRQCVLSRLQLNSQLFFFLKLNTKYRELVPKLNTEKPVPKTSVKNFVPNPSIKNFVTKPAAEI